MRSSSGIREQQPFTLLHRLDLTSLHLTRIVRHTVLSQRIELSRTIRFPVTKLLCHFQDIRLGYLPIHWLFCASRSTFSPVYSTQVSEVCRNCVDYSGLSDLPMQAMLDTFGKYVYRAISHDQISINTSIEL